MKGMSSISQFKRTQHLQTAKAASPSVQVVRKAPYRSRSPSLLAARHTCRCPHVCARLLLGLPFKDNERFGYLFKIARLDSSKEF